MKGKYLLQDVLAALIILTILYLFYRSIYVVIPAIPCFFIYKHFANKQNLKRKKETLTIQFKDFLMSMSASLRAGYSIENSLHECYAEMKMLYGEGSPICRETKIMLNQIRISLPMEKIFAEFAERSAVADIEIFSSVFSVAKRNGGDMVEIIQKTADDISARIETKKEIELMIASKKFEQNIMNFVPLGIIVYISISSGGLLDPLYGNITGIIIMTICLALYAFAFFLSKRIMDIEI